MYRYTFYYNPEQLSYIVCITCRYWRSSFSHYFSFFLCDYQYYHLLFPFSDHPPYFITKLPFITKLLSPFFYFFPTNHPRFILYFILSRRLSLLQFNYNLPYFPYPYFLLSFLPKTSLSPLSTLYSTSQYSHNIFSSFFHSYPALIFFNLFFLFTIFHTFF